MLRLTDRLGFALAGAIGVALLAVLAGIVSAGPIDPADPPASTDGVRLPGTPISALPFAASQPGHYYLTRSLAINDLDAISVTAPDVSIDLGGFTLSGNQSPGDYGVRISSGLAHRLTVTNGTIRDFDTGIFALTADNRFSDLTLYSNNTGIAMGVGNVLTDCEVNENIDGAFITNNFTEIRRCTFRGNGSRGIAVNDGIFSGFIERSFFVANNTFSGASGGGIVSEGNRLTIRDNTFMNNAVRDIHLTADDNVMIDNVFTCPGRVTLVVGADNNFFPENTADPHTNRLLKAVC